MQNLPCATFPFALNPEQKMPIRILEIIVDNHIVLVMLLLANNILTRLFFSLNISWQNTRFFIAMETKIMGPRSNAQCTTTL